MKMNQELIYIRLTEEHKFERIFNKEDCFDTFINGFKLIMINSKLIRSVYVNDTILRTYPIKNNLKEIAQNLLDTIGGYYDLVIASDIHLHCFHLELMLALSRKDRIKRVIVAGDILYKEPYEEQRPSVKQATEATSKILTTNLPLIYEAETMKITDSDLTDKDKFIWLTGNHDKPTSVPSTCKKLITLLEHLALVYEAKVGDYEFRIQHSALEDEYDPRITRPEKLSDKFDKYMTGNKYLILGHDWHYCRYKNDDIVNKYEEDNKHKVFLIGVGKYTLTDEYAEDGPEYIFYDGTSDVRGKFNLVLAFDLDQQCVQANIEKQSHMICSDNIRAITPINMTDTVCPYEMFGGGKLPIKHHYLILILIIVLVLIVILVICIVTACSKLNNNLMMESVRNEHRFDYVTWWGEFTR